MRRRYGTAAPHEHAIAGTYVRHQQRTFAGDAHHAMREHHALGRAGGAGGIDQAQRVERREVGGARALLFQRRYLAGEFIEPCQPVLQLRQFGQRFGEAALGNEQRGGAMLQQVTDAGRLQTHVDRHPHHAAQHQRVDQRHVVKAVLEHQRDAVAAADTARGEALLHGRDAHRHIGERRFAAVEDDQGALAVFKQAFEQQRDDVELVVAAAGREVVCVAMHGGFGSIQIIVGEGTACVRRRAIL